MQSRHATRATTVALAIAAALSLGFAPAVDSGTQSEPESSSAAGKCLEGYAYVTVNGSSYGITSTRCVKPTSCTSAIGSGPAHHGVGPVAEDHYVQVPTTSGGNVSCYL